MKRPKISIVIDVIMLMLESKVTSIDEYKNAAFFNHLLIIKGGERL